MIGHEYAQLFPMLSDDELAEMAADIKCRGLLNPIVTYHGEVLDGRNRLRACELADVKPSFVEYAGTDPLADVLSWNLHRRQLDASQRSAIALKVKPIFEEQAKQRMHDGKKIDPKANLPQGASRDQAAAACGVSPRMVQDAQFVRDHSPEMFEQVKEGKITVNAAKNQIKEEAERKEEEKYKQPANEVLKVNAQVIADKAIFILTQIKKHDKGRVEALESVIAHCHAMMFRKEDYSRTGKGIEIACDAIKVLRQISNDDPLRKEGGAMVTKWITDNIMEGLK